MIVQRADSQKENMGLMTWKNSPYGLIRKSDISVAKNYLTEEELAALNRIVVMYLDYAENQALKRTQMHMADWIKKLDAFLEFNEENILTHAGRVSSKMASDHVEKEFNKYENKRRQIEVSQPISDFDKVVAKLPLTDKSPRKK